MDGEKGWLGAIARGERGSHRWRKGKKSLAGGREEHTQKKLPEKGWRRHQRNCRRKVGEEVEERKQTGERKWVGEREQTRGWEK